MTVYSKGLLIGRFQPFHKGHLYLLHHVKKKVKKLVIGIGSANVYDEDNLFTYEERKEMIETVLKKEKLQTFVTRIIPLNDYYDDERWFRHTIQKTGKTNLIIGNNEWTNDIFEKRGYTILRVSFFKRYLYEGEKIRGLISNGKQWNDRVPDYLTAPIINFLNKRKKIPYRFQRIGIGGTFDHFHRGHKKLIDTALRYGHFVSIGVTTKPLHAEKNFSEAIENYEQRKKSMIDYLKKKHELKRATFFPLSDIYGTTKTDGMIEAIVVSTETYPNAIKINKLRHKKGLPELKIIRIDDVKADDGKLISSERIRGGEIDREGKNFLPIQSGSNFQKKTLFLPEYLRGKLRKPLGEVIKGDEDGLEKTASEILHYINIMKSRPPMVIAVGDIISNSLEKTGFIPDLKIIDYRSRRHPIKRRRTLKGPSHVNAAGTINLKSTDAIKKAIEKHLKTKRKQKIIINGEEDLLTLIAILSSPLKAIVLYGQMDLGVVMVEVDETIKNNVLKILNKFRVQK